MEFDESRVSPVPPAQIRETKKIVSWLLASYMNLCLSREILVAPFSINDKTGDPESNKNVEFHPLGLIHFFFT